MDNLTKQFVSAGVSDPVRDPQEKTDTDLLCSSYKETEAMKKAVEPDLILPDSGVVVRSGSGTVVRKGWIRARFFSFLFLGRIRIGSEHRCSH